MTDANKNNEVLAALAWLRANDPKRAETFSADDGCVDVFRKVWGRRKDGTIIGLSYGGASYTWVPERKCIVDFVAYKREKIPQEQQLENARKFEAAQERAKASKHVEGAEGAKVELDVVLERIGGYSSDYGYTKVYTFRCADGAVGVWKTTSAGLDLEVGDSARIKGTIKRHGEYRAVPQSELSRVKLISAQRRAA